MLVKTQKTTIEDVIVEMPLPYYAMNIAGWVVKITEDAILEATQWSISYTEKKLIQSLYDDKVKLSIGSNYKQISEDEFSQVIEKTIDTMKSLYNNMSKLSKS
jgi:hypothetical protein